MQVFMAGQYDLRRLARCQDLLVEAEEQQARGRKPLIVDAGANIGAATIYFSFLFPAAHIIALEPAPENFALLQCNTQGLDVVCLEAALASHAMKVSVHDVGAGFWGYRTEATEGPGGVPAVSIGEIYAGCSSSHFPFLVKIDVEGAEEEIFSAHTEWVQETPLVIIELHDWMLPGRRSAQNFLRCIAALDRDFVQHSENIFSIRNS
jgi:FkbM family methyltransferase